MLIKQSLIVDCFVSLILEDDTRLITRVEETEQYYIVTCMITQMQLRFRRSISKDHCLMLRISAENVTKTQLDFFIQRAPLALIEFITYHEE